MPVRHLISNLLCIALVFAATRSAAQGPPDPSVTLPAQRKAMQPLAFMDGVWRGPAWTIVASGDKHSVTQTERIGPFLDSTVKVIEGRGYDAAGKVSFNAFGTVSFDPARHSYTLHSYARGMVGDFAFTPNDSGYVWEIPAGPTTLRYTAVIRHGNWREIGERLAPGQASVQFFEMNLERVRGTDWPSAGAIGAK